MLGAGSWGTALAVLLARTGVSVRLWDRDGQHIAAMLRQHVNQRYLPGIPLPEQVLPVEALGRALTGVDFGLVAWLVGVVVGVVVAAVTIIFNIQKWVIIFFTATGGAGVIVGSLLFALGVINVADIGDNAVQAALQDSIFWTIIYVVLAILGFLSQFATTQTYVLEEPANRI